MRSTRAVLLVMAVTGSLANGHAVVRMSGWLSGAPRVAEAAQLSGIATLSGTVQSVLYPDMDKIATLGAYYLNGPPGYLFTPAAPTRAVTQTR